MKLSPPSRAAWIEMAELNPFAPSYPSPPSRAAWIEIHISNGEILRRLGRRLHGRRGLKFSSSFIKTACRYRSPPSRAAWIEIFDAFKYFPDCQSPPSRAAWIEMPLSVSEPYQGCGRRLHGRRGLKLFRDIYSPCIRDVAAFTGGVD